MLNLKEITEFVDNAHLSLWIWDVKRHDFVFFSKELIKLFELLTNKEVTKKEVRRFLDENTPHDLDFIINEFDENQEFFYSYFISLPDGETKWLDTKIVGLGKRRNEIDLAVGFVDERVDRVVTKSSPFLYNEDQYTGLPDLTYGWQFLKKIINKNEQKILPLHYLK